MVRADGLLGGATETPKLAMKNTSVPATVMTISTAIRTWPCKKADSFSWNVRCPPMGEAWKTFACTSETLKRINDGHLCATANTCPKKEVAVLGVLNHCP